MGKELHKGKPTSIYLNDNVKYVLDKVVVPERKRINSKASRSDVINLILSKVFQRKGYLDANGELKSK